MIYHLLGAAIPHHNRTLCHFLFDTLHVAAAEHRVYVVGNAAAWAEMPVVVFPSQRHFARAVVRLAQTEPAAIFVLHGQFNRWIWWAIFRGVLPAERVVWHVWGADLYESSRRWQWRLFYLFRRRVQKMLPHIWATQGDLAFVWRHCRARTATDRRLYFPTRLASSPPAFVRPQEPCLTVLLGNSGDPSNRHMDGLTQIAQRLGRAVKIVIPMGYPSGNQAYIAQVEQHSKRYFSAENVQILREQHGFEEYMACVAQCDLGYFPFTRQQGVGTLCLLLQQRIPFVLHPDNPFCLDLQAANLPFLTETELTPLAITACRDALQAVKLDEVPFFPAHYEQDWRTALADLVQRKGIATEHGEEGGATAVHRPPW